MCELQSAAHRLQPVETVQSEKSLLQMHSWTAALAWCSSFVLYYRHYFWIGTWLREDHSGLSDAMLALYQDKSFCEILLQPNVPPLAAIMRIKTTWSATILRSGFESLGPLKSNIYNNSFWMRPVIHRNTSGSALNYILFFTIELQLSSLLNSLPFLMKKNIVEVWKHSPRHLLSLFK